MELNNIISGWKNTVIKDSEVEKLSQQRSDICNRCEYKKALFGIEVCGVCHCPLLAKTRSVDSKCPKDRW